MQALAVCACETDDNVYPGPLSWVISKRASRTLGIAILSTTKNKPRRKPPTSLLKQMVQDCSTISDNVKSFYNLNRHQNRDTHPTFDNFTDAPEWEIGNVFRALKLSMPRMNAPRILELGPIF